MADLRLREAMILVARETAARLLFLGNAKSAGDVHANTYNTPVAQAMDQVKNQNLLGALDITRMALYDNEQREPNKKVPKEVLALLQKLEHTLRKAMGPLQ